MALVRKSVRRRSKQERRNHKQENESQLLHGVCLQEILQKVIYGRNMCSFVILYRKYLVSGALYLPINERTADSCGSLRALRATAFTVRSKQYPEIYRGGVRWPTQKVTVSVTSRTLHLRSLQRHTSERKLHRLAGQILRRSALAYYAPPD